MADRLVERRGPKTTHYRLLPHERQFGVVLRLPEHEKPVCVAAVPLLPLTGCRPGEIRCLRHVRASRAVMNGPGLHVDERLLGHRWATTINRYVHLDDATLSQAAERVATVVDLNL